MQSIDHQKLLSVHRVVDRQSRKLQIYTHVETPTDPEPYCAAGKQQIMKANLEIAHESTCGSAYKQQNRRLIDTGCGVSFVQLSG